MSKKLVANPIAGLQGVPPRIILNERSLTIKKGIIGNGTTIPYSGISCVTYKRQLSTTLSGSIFITPLSGKTIQVDGFYKTQFKVIEKAVNNGFYQDKDDNDDSVVDTDHSKNRRDRTIGYFDDSEINESQTGPSPKIHLFGHKDDNGQSAVTQEQIPYRESEIDIVNKIVVETSQVDKMLDVLNDLFSRFDTADRKTKKAIKAKYSLQLEYLKSYSPAHPLLKMFIKKLKDMEDSFLF